MNIVSEFKKNIIIPLIISFLYFIFNFIYITKFYFWEDAYIMFRYVEMFVQGYGITYYPGGEPTEGATDFLWFVLLSVLRWLHIDVGIAAIILNSIGAFLISYTIVGLINSIKEQKTRIAFYPLSFLWLAFIPVIAAIGGFSVLLYTGLNMLALHILCKGKQVVWIPILAVIIALFRPDGVILGAGLSLVGLYFVSKENMKRYFLNILIAFLIGISYFIWRYNYFGELLPLPLYVKQTVSIYTELLYNLSDLKSPAILFSLLLFIIVYLFQEKSKKLKIGILFLPFFLLFCSFLLSHQTQNIANRFQAPIIFALYYLFIYMILNIRPFILYSFYGIMCLVGVLIFNVLTKKNAHYSYSDTLSYNLNKHILSGNETLAISEAGSFIYWIDKPVKVVDLVGLNTKYIAKNRLTPEYIKSVNPDILLVFFNNNFSSATENIYWQKDRTSFDKNIIISKYRSDKIAQAEEATKPFLLKYWDEYDVFYVRYLGRDFYHVYAIKKSLHKSQLFYDLLNEAYSNPKSYWELKGKMK